MGWRSPWCPASLTQMSAIQSTHPVLTEDRSWFFLSKYSAVWPVSTSYQLEAASVPCCSMETGQRLFLRLSGHFSFNRLVPRGVAASLAAGLPAGMWCADFRTVVKRSAISLGSQVWLINSQCCCLTINEVTASGQDWLYPSDASRLPAGCSPLVRASLRIIVPGSVHTPLPHLLTSASSR